MSELILTPMPYPGSFGVNGVPEGTPVFIFFNKEPNGDHRNVNKSNILYVKKAIGGFLIEKENKDVLDWLISQGKDVVFLQNKINEMTHFNNEIAVLILKTLHKLTWKTLPANNEWIGDGPNNVPAARLGTINTADALKLLTPAYKSMMEIYGTLLEEKYPSKLVSTGLRHVVEQQKLEVSQKTGKLLK